LPLFFARASSYKDFMSSLFGWGARLGAMWNENKGGPWGPSGGGSGGGGDGGSGSGGPRSPWGQPPRKRPGGIGGPGNVASLDDFLKKSRDRFGGRFPTGGDGRPYWLYGLGIFLLLWLVFTSFHRIGP
jgi:membrane protease subunit HflK